MLHLEEKQIGPTPILILYENDLAQAQARGSILFVHGLGADKNVQRKELDDLARHGFLVVGIDAVGHGQRRDADFETRFSAENPQVLTDVLTVVWESAQEIPDLVDGLIAEGYINQDKLGMAGISLGGFITYSAITLEARLKVASTMVASPRWMLDWPQSPHKHLDKFGQIRLLCQSAGLDENVPPQAAREFHQALQAKYADYAERMAYINYPQSGHFMRPEDWETSWAKLIDWFKRHF